jgi:DNA processing protein
MLNTKSQTESFYHALLVLRKSLSIGTLSADKKTRAMLEKYGSFENIFQKSLDLFPEDFLKSDLAEELKDKTERHDFRTLTVNDALFPQFLKAIPYASPVLYVKGNISLLDTKTIAVVGTRELSQNNVEDAESCLERLLKKGYTIVSGLAEGCDALAHKYAVRHNGSTIAVLGTPLDRSYPKENKKLQEEIAKNHLLISQYPIGLRPFPSYFAHRNITTVGLSKEGVVVIEAPDSSGTQHAIKECVKTKKPLYVLENNLERGFEWTRALAGSYKVVKR